MNAMLKSVAEFDSKSDQASLDMVLVGFRIFIQLSISMNFR